MTTRWIPMTPGGYREMKDELEALQLQAGPPATGGWSTERALPGFGTDRDEENGSADPASHPMRERILALKEKIGRARVIEPGNRDRVFFGARVKVLDRNHGKVLEYALVGPEELDPDSGRISSASPIGRALIGRRAGETVTIRVPRGELRLEILGFR